MIQVDESAICEGLPLRRQDWETYLRWAVYAFKLATSGVLDETQIHTHMCYSEFGDILEAIAEMDADVISIETSRLKMEQLADFARFRYPNEIGLGGIRFTHRMDRLGKRWRNFSFVPEWFCRRPGSG